MHIEVKRKSNGLPVLSKGDIEEIPEAYLWDFDTYEFANDMSRELAGIFNVSIQAASIRLRQLKLVREETV